MTQLLMETQKDVDVTGIHCTMQLAHGITGSKRSCFTHAWQLPVEKFYS